MNKLEKKHNEYKAKRNALKDEEIVKTNRIYNLGEEEFDELFSVAYLLGVDWKDLVKKGIKYVVEPYYNKDGKVDPKPTNQDNLYYIEDRKMFGQPYVVLFKDGQLIKAPASQFVDGKLVEKNK